MWLDATFYYCEHFEKIKEIISNLYAETATIIDKANNLNENFNLKNNLCFILQIFVFFVHTLFYYIWKLSHHQKPTYKTMFYTIQNF